LRKSIIVATAVAAFAVSSTPAVADALMDAMRECMAVEQNKPNSIRGGMSALDFCSAQAIIQTRS
jgi:hypothetical protein